MNNPIEQVKREIPSVDEIINATWRKLNFKKEFVRKKFGEAIVKFDEEATKEFKEHEKKPLRKLAEIWINSYQKQIREKLKIAIERESQEEFINKLSEIFWEFGLLVQRLEKDLGNMRKARGGKTFEKVIVINFIGVKCEMPKGKIKEKLKRIDIVIPSEELAIKKPDRAIFITCKRTLRERWKQEVPAAGPNQRIYLITIDEELSENKVKEIMERGLIVFVRDEIKKRFKDNDWVRKLSDLPKEVKI
jgi:EcoRII C terminal.